jgi:nucleoside 2-deoxyribosyltransferase
LADNEWYTESVKKKWFISHPSGSQQHTPTFFKALDNFAAENGTVDLMWPQLEPNKMQLTQDDIQLADLVLVEVSVASTGSGIELGWAHAAKKPIIAFHQGTSVISPAIQFVADAIHVYITEEHIVKVLKTLV